MMFRSDIAAIVALNTSKNPLYLRNLIKEEVQNYILNFVYTSQAYNTKLFFTGGTCLRRVYGLNRLSEDLDFDYPASISVEKFAGDILQYFQSEIQYRQMSASISGNGQSVFFKLPILKELKIYQDRTPEDIFVRCDFSKDRAGNYELDSNLINAGPFQFFVRSYDLATLFSNKFVAFLERVFYRGNLQKTPFKGRDAYDLFWLMQLSARSSYSLKMNQARLYSLLGEKDKIVIKKLFVERVNLLEPKYLYDDLLPLMESKSVLDGFMDGYKKYLLKYVDFVL